MNSKIKTTLIVLTTVVCSLLVMKGLCSVDVSRPWAWTRFYLPAVGEIERVKENRLLQQQLQIDRDTILSMQNELVWYQDQIDLAKDPNMVYNPTQDVYMPRSWVEDPKDTKIAELEDDLGVWADKTVELQKQINKLTEHNEPVVILEPVPTLQQTIQNTIDSVVHIMNETQGWQGSGVAISEDIIFTARHVNELHYRAAHRIRCCNDHGPRLSAGNSLLDRTFR